MFADLTVLEKEVYIHQQVTLVMRFFYPSSARAQLSEYEAPTGPGFVEREIGGGQGREYTQEVNGRLYRVWEMRTALFPFQSGELTVEPAKLKGVILVPAARQRRRMDPFFDFDEFFGDSFFGGFGNYVKKPFELASGSVTVKVKPLPKEGAPQGEVSVGTYRMEVEVKPKEVRVGEPITIVTRVSGAGDLETMEPPAVSNLENFKSYEATSSTDVKEQGGRIMGVKTFEQAIVPQSDKVNEIPPVVFNYFDPEKKQYLTLQKGPFPVRVLPAKESATGIVSLPGGKPGRGVKILERNIVFIKTDPGMLVKGRLKVLPSWSFWLLNLLPPVLLLLAFLHNRHRVRMKMDRGYARFHGAGRATRERLKSVEAALKAGNAEEFYSGLVRAVNSYIADRLNMPPGGLTPEIVGRRLRERGVKEAILKELDIFYRDCDVARFAPKETGAKQMREEYKRAGDIINDLRKSKL
jgi:hypothetical protein